jgi:uncharacterized membrane protein YfcA
LLSLLDITLTELMLALTGAFIMGFAKTGLPGLALINVIIMAQLFGAKESIGIVLPLLVFCDFVIYPIYHKYASWKKVWPLLPPTIIGVILGSWILESVPDETMKSIIGWTIAGMVVLQVIQARSQQLLAKLPNSMGFLIGAGLTIGVSTTMANAAGPAFSIWALIRRLSKEDFLGIGARYFLFVNLLKLPFFKHAEVVSQRTLLIDLALLPAVILGILIGRQVIKRLPQKSFEWVLFALCLAGALWLILG